MAPGYCPGVILYDSMIAPEALNMIQGDLPVDHCELLFSIARSLPSDSVVLDFGPGEGRSSIVLGMGLVDGVVVSVDPFTNPMSDSPVKESVLPIFMNHIHRFGAYNILPLVSGVGMIPKLFGKRCANLVVIQVPKHSGSIDGYLKLAFTVGLNALRTKGKIVAICPNDFVKQEMDAIAPSILGNCLAKSYEFMRVYEPKE